MRGGGSRGRGGPTVDERVEHCGAGERPSKSASYVGVVTHAETRKGKRTCPEEDEGEAVAERAGDEGFRGFDKVASGVRAAVGDGIGCADRDTRGEVEGESCEVGEAEDAGEGAGDAGGCCAREGEGGRGGQLARVRVSEGEGETHCSLRSRGSGCCERGWEDRRDCRTRW